MQIFDRKTIAIPGPQGTKGEKGDQGDRGLPGMNAVPADEAIAELVGVPSETRFALVKNFDRVVTSPGVSTDATAMLNAALAATSTFGIRRRVSLVGDFLVSGAVVIPSRTTVDARGATIRLAPGSTSNLAHIGQVAPLRTGVSDATTVPGTTASGLVRVSSASLGLTAADVGRAIAVYHSTIEYGVIAYGEIVSVTGDTATVRGACSHLVTAGVAEVYDIAQDVEVIGGVWDKGNSPGVRWHTHVLRARRVRGLKLHGLTILSKAGKYAISLGDVQRWDVRDIHFDSWSDGVHIQGPASGGTVSGLYGKTHDDMLAITSTDWYPYGDVIGDVIGVEASGIYPDGSLAAFKLISGTNTEVRNVQVRGVSGTTRTRPLCIRGDEVGDTTATNVLFEDVHVIVPAEHSTSGATEGLLYFQGSGAGGLGGLGIVSGCDARNITIRNSSVNRQSTSDGGLVHILDGSRGVKIDNLVVENIHNRPLAGVGIGNNGQTHALYADAPLGVVRISGCTARGGSGTGGTVAYVGAAQGSITDLSVTKARGEAGSRGIVHIRGPIARLTLQDVESPTNVVQTENNARVRSAMVVRMQDVALTHPTGGRILSTAGPTKVYLSNVTATSEAGGKITFLDPSVVGSEIHGAIRMPAGSVLARGGYDVGVTVSDPTLPIDVTTVIPTAGAACWNSNASGLVGLGVGPAVCNGSQWKSLYTGATFTPAIIDSITPSGAGAGATITITGRGLAGAQQVSVGGTAATILSTTATQITATMPSGTPGNVLVKVNNSSGVGSNGVYYTRG